MSAETIITDDELDLRHLEFFVNVRDRYVSHRIAEFEDDPEMSEYEDMIALGRSLCRA